eukprot:12700082-Alexandrium_andersonii.AAC.1
MQARPHALLRGWGASVSPRSRDRPGPRRMATQARTRARYCGDGAPAQYGNASPPPRAATGVGRGSEPAEQRLPRAAPDAEQRTGGAARER